MGLGVDVQWDREETGDSLTVELGVFFYDDRGEIVDVLMDVVIDDRGPVAAEWELVSWLRAELSESIVRLQRERSRSG